MLTTFAVRQGALLRGEEAAPLRGAVWIDLLDPTPEEERLVEEAVGFELPSREEMQEIESSSRMYREGDVLFLTANFLHGVDGGTDYASTPISFVVAPSVLITVRHATPKAFSVFTARCQKAPEALLGSPDAVLLHLFGQIVDRLADILERIGMDIDRANQDAFRAARSAKKVTQKDQDLRSVLLTLGLVGDLTARTTDTLLGLTRILTFLTAEKSAVRKENQHLIKTLVRDVRSLVEHGNSMNHKATFLLDAVLGIINVEQMNIIKTFTVVSVALMPPTLIASIYGMNFQHMPELEWPIGYPLAVLAMILSALGPVMYFKRKGWL